MIPTFGKTTIRRFDGNVSELKRLTGSELEDTLQVYPFASVGDSHADYEIPVHHPLRQRSPP